MTDHQDPSAAGPFSIRAWMALAAVGMYALASESLLGALIAFLGFSLFTRPVRDALLANGDPLLSAKAVARTGTALFCVAIGLCFYKNMERANLREQATLEARQATERVTTARLSGLETRMNALFRKAQGVQGWNEEALAIAKALNEAPNRAAEKIIQKWRGNPAVQAAYSADLTAFQAGWDQEAREASKQTQASYASLLDTVLLKNGTEALVTTERLGTKEAAIVIRSALAGRVFADRIANGNKWDVANSAKSVGIATLKFVNTITGEIWAQDLGEPAPLDEAAREHAGFKRWALAD